MAKPSERRKTEVSYTGGTRLYVVLWATTIFGETRTFQIILNIIRLKQESLGSKRKNTG